MPELIVKLVFCHLCGDFILQTDRMNHEVLRKKSRSLFLYLHPLIHGLLIMLVMGFDLMYLPAAIVITLSHLIIDPVARLYISRWNNGIVNLLTEQALHMIIIACVAFGYVTFDFNWSNIFSVGHYLLASALILITFGISAVVKKMMMIFDYSVPAGGLADAGKYIGMLERLFIFMFIVISFREGIGFLLAAKSIFRFGDLKESKEVKLTEYILIGTLLSFGLAMGISELYMKILGSVN